MARLGIKARLGLVALAPTVAVAVGAGSIASDKAAFRSQVLTLRAVAQQVDLEVRLHAAIDHEQALSQILVRLPAFGVTAKVAGAFLGRDVQQNLLEQRRMVDELLTRIPVGLRSDVAPLVAQGRGEIDEGTLDQHRLGDRYDDAAAQVGRAADADLADMGRRGGDLPGSISVLRAVESAQGASAVSDAGVRQSAALAELIFTPEVDRGPKLVQLAAVHTRFVAGRDALAASSGRTVDAALAALTARPTVAQYLERLGKVAEAGDLRTLPDGLDKLALVGVFRGALDFEDGLPGLVSAATDQLLLSSDRAAAAAGEELTSALLVLTAVLAGTLLLAGLNAVSLARPLRRLADDVRAVQLGELDRAVTGASRTREIGVLQEAVSDLVTNLRTVDQQARALAAGELDSPALAERVPGKLGLALQESVARLSSAMADERGMRDRLEHEASHDALTGLMNRSGVLLHTQRTLAGVARVGRTAALLFIDLDDFKRVNDSHGHAVGDEVLKTVAHRLAAAARAGDVVARLGGDEFVAVMPDVDGVDQAVALAERLLDAARQPIVVDGDRCVVGASIGVTLAGDAQLDALELLEQADVAVFRAKVRGKGRVEVFDAALQRQLEEHAEIERALAAGMARGEVIVHYQPIVDPVRLEAVGVEALARWERPGHGLVPPAVFIPVAEDSDLIIELGRHVLRVATAGVAQHLPVGTTLELAVNVSARHVASGNLLDDVRDALAASGLPPALLTVEITETVLVTDLPFLAEQLEQLRLLGVRVAIDDFGTGFTSLAHLRHLPADIIKIDRSFVSEMDADGGSLVRLVTDLGHHLGLAVVAEGVETDEQLGLLRGAGCDLVQGYLIGRPMPGEALGCWLGDRAARFGLATAAAEVE